MKRYETILVRETGSHLEISLNRPEKRNALNNQIVLELKDAFKSGADNSPIKTISLKGEGRAFCSGADLAHLKKLSSYTRDQNLSDSKNLAELYLSIYLHPKPVVAIVEGPAMAGGCGLASVCDFVYATEEALFGYPEVRIGFVAALVSLFLRRQVGDRKAKELLLSGKSISSSEAKKINLINEVYPNTQILEAEEKLLETLQNNSTSAMTNTKRLFIPNIKEELEFLTIQNANFREEKDFVEGITSFIEKRQPNWDKV